MAQLDGPEGEGISRRRRHRRNYSPPGRNDWVGAALGPAPSPPRHRSRGEIHRASPAGEWPPRRGPPPPSPTTTHAWTALSSPSLRVHSSAMPLLVRPSALVPTRTTTTTAPPQAIKAPPYYDDRSRSQSRRGTDSHRDTSPRSAHHYRSTPDTRRSSRTSLTESDEETEVTVSSQEEEEREEDGGDGDGEDIIPDKESLRDRIDIRRRERRRGRRDNVIYEEDLEVIDLDQDEDRVSRRAPSVATRRSTRRSPSRHSTRTQDHRSASRKSLRRASSVEDDRRTRASSRRSSKRYHEAELPVVHIEKPSTLRRAHTTAAPSHAASSHSMGGSSKRSSVLGSFLGLPPHPHSHPGDRTARLVECVVCMDEVSPSKAAKLKCGHRMCTSCLKRSFKLSVTDPAHMPPRCCTTDHIPLRHVDKLLDTNFKRTWNRKFREFSTRNRIYCPSRRCGEWIKPENIYREDGRKVARCGRCRTKVCGLCNGKWHASRDCPRDEETKRFLEQAKQEGWQRCHRCKAMVELKEGCNHMTCRCGAEFCMICGAKWKSCECPWFNYEAVENDRLEHMQLPTGNPFEAPPSPPRDRDFRGRPPLPAGSGARPPRPQTYEEEMYVRRQQEQRDEELARRLQAFGSFDDDEDDYMEDVMGPDELEQEHGRYFPNDEYRRRPETIAVPPPPPPPAPQVASPFERTDRGGDYVSGVNRARGVRASSLERRLADRFNTDHRSPMHRQTAPPPPPPPPAPMSMSGMPPMPSMGRMPMAPMVPPPPATVAPGSPLMRRHTMEDDYLYQGHSLNLNLNHNSTMMRARSPPERLTVPRRTRHSSYIEEDGMPPPSFRRRGRRSERGRGREREREPKMSMLAGLTGVGRGMDRVSEWRTHVEPGTPDDEAATVAAA